MSGEARVAARRPGRAEGPADGVGRRGEPVPAAGRVPEVPQGEPAPGRRSTTEARRAMDRGPLRILSGVKVLSFTQFLLGPAGVQYLADLGADVLKVEPPGTGAWERSWAGADTFVNGASALHLAAHRNTRSLSLNLKHPEGQAIARRLAAGTDVLVQNFRPGVLERFGLAYEAVRQRNPSVIYVSASGYGEDGPYRDLPGQDLLLQALCGLAAMTGREDEPPTPVGAAVVDQHGAALLAMGVLAALYHRQRTGEGQQVEVTMVQAALDLQLEPIVYYLNGAAMRRSRAGLGSPFHPAPYGVYATRDGHLALSLSPVRALREALGGAPELAPYEAPGLAWPKREAIRRALAPLLRARTTAEWVDEFRRHGIWCAPVQSYPEVFADPGVRHLDPVLEVDHPQAGRVRLLRHPVRYSSGTPRASAPPTLGQHTEEVLASLGYGPADIERLRDLRVI